jgi:transposase
MEATGVYWKPVWHVLEGHFELVLANAAHVKNVPGRKTDVNDAMWLADLLAHGLIRASFVPPVAVQELRTLTRTRKQFVRERAAHAQRIEKVLEDANLKLSVVISDILGKSGRAVLQAIIDGQSDPERLLVRHHARQGQPQPSCSKRCVGASARTTASCSSCTWVTSMPGSGHRRHREGGGPGAGAVSTSRQAAEHDARPERGQANVVIAEIGIDMSRFATPGHLLSWACMCPRNDESAGKRRSTRLRRGGKWLKTTMVQAAWAAVKVKGSYLQAQFHRLRARRGAKKAIIAWPPRCSRPPGTCCATAPSIDLGAAHFDRADAHKTATRLIRRLQQIGYTVQATPVEEVSFIRRHPPACHQRPRQDAFAAHA